MFVAITNTPREYAWGSHLALSELLGTIASGKPEAELWLGAHPISPSVFTDPAGSGFANLLEFVQAEPQQALGERSVAVHGERLPFLLKVLAAAGPLSLQAHPSPERARAGFELENDAGIALDAPERNYKDPFHKPELIVALSETFDALCGFRSPEQIDAIIAELRRADAASADPQPAPIDTLAAKLRGSNGLRNAVEWLLRDGREEDSGEVAWLVERVVALAASDELTQGPYAREFATVLSMADAYPGDPGIVLALLLNRVTLGPGEALYLPAGNIHAYLDGLGVELMAASDNVLRGGLTPKHIDVDELLEVLNFDPAPIPHLLPEQPAPGVLLYRPDVPDFALYAIARAETDAAASVKLGGAAIALCTAGTLQLVGENSSVAVSRGEIVYVTPDEESLSITGTGSLFIATVGAEPAA